jgi:hypothetical protein
MTSGAAVARLVTFVDVREARRDRMSFSARHEAVLDDGRRVLLLDGRGWTEEPGTAYATSAEDVEQTARVVVGPDEPFEGRSQEDMEVGHWNFLADALRKHGIGVDASSLRRLQHDVVLSERLLAVLRGGPA